MTQLSEGVKIAANGRMVLPIGIRRALGIEGETKVVVTVEDGIAKIEPLAVRVKRAQDMYQALVKNPSTVDEFLAGRKQDEVRRNRILSGKYDD